MDRRTALKEICGAPALIGVPVPAHAVWDVHCHLVGVPGETPVERMVPLVKFADRAGIERLVLLMGFPLLDDPVRSQNRIGSVRQVV